MLDKLLHFSLTQRFLVLATGLVVAGAGIASWKILTLDAVPDITPNQVQVNTETGGMSPEEIEKLVTFPVETAMGGIPGVQEVRSMSQYGLSQVTVTFREDVDIFFARQLVFERLASVREQIPSNVEAPQMGPVATGLGDIYMYAIESDERSPMELRTIQDWFIAPQIRTVPGVAEVSAADGSQKQYQVIVKPRALIARGIAVDEVVSALQKNNSNAGGGVVEHSGERVYVRSVGMATKVSDIERVPVKSEGGVPVLVKDVAEVKLGIPVLTGVSTMNGKETMVAVVMMLKGANGRTVADAVDAKVQEIKGQLPKDVKLTAVYNRSDLVNTTVHTVQTSLLEGGALVIAVLLVLLGNLRGALIVALAIPLSMLVAVIGMNRFGISGNLMSLGAIDFGLIVDGAVVMIENAVRRVAEAREREGRTLTRHEVRHTVLESSREVAQPTAFAVAIITVVYLPILALEGIEGKMFKPMAFTVVFALIGALILTLTLIPTLASMVLSVNTREARNPVMALLSKLYRPTLGFALRWRWLIVGGAAGLIVLAGIVFSRLGSEFIPQLDEGSILLQPVRLRTVSALETVRLVAAAEKKVLEIPEVSHVFSKSGTPEVAMDAMPLSLTDTFIMLKPRDTWRSGMTKSKLIAEIEEKANEVPGQGYGFTQPIQMRFSELIAGVKADVGIKVFGEDLKILKAKADEAASIVNKIQGAEDVEVEQVDEVPVLQIDINRDAIARQGVNVSEIQELIAVALGGEPIGQVVEGDKRFALTVRLPENIRNDVDALGALPIETPVGGHVPLSTLASLNFVPAPAQISRESGKRRVVVQLNVRGRDLGSFVKEAQTALKSKMALPEGYYVTWGGQFENLQKASARLLIVVPVALALIFVLLFTTFGSIKQAILIFSGVPLAITGGVVALALRGIPFSITAGVGFIALSGVAVLNGVVMVSAINHLRKDGRAVQDAVNEGAQLRLRPVLMTALVAALGFIPMALNTGIGAEVQRPLATVVIGGIASATLLTLVVLPVLYVWLHKDPEVVEDV
ncbi:MAG: efflux RND transporter permease subunit [Armatimonadetes bacterium]|nr:efflux RND transporter permease subunit [Armatimonadota bacterium]